MRPAVDTVIVVAVPDPREALLRERFAAAAEAVALRRADVDIEIARELMAEAATVLHNSLVLDELDERDHATVVDDLASDLTAVDPTAAVRRRAATVREDTTRFDDPAAAAAAYESVGAVLRL